MRTTNTQAMRKVLLIALAAQLAVTIVCPADRSLGRGGRDVQPSFPIRAAFYYPWFPETWGHGSTFPFTRYHPSLGYYSSASRAVIRRHVEALRYAHVEAGIVSWWAGRNRGDARLATILRVTRALRSSLRWAVYYEPEGYSDPSISEIHADLGQIERRYGHDPAYLRARGRPVVFVYAGGADGCAMAERWFRANGNRRAYVVLKVFPGYRACKRDADSWHQYAPAHASDEQRGYSFSVSPGFWLAGEDRPRLARDPARFRSDVRRMVSSKEPWQLVTTFNEWGEGTAVESAKEWSDGTRYGLYLEALHRDESASRAGATGSPARQRCETSCSNQARLVDILNTDR